MNPPVSRREVLAATAWLVKRDSNAVSWLAAGGECAWPDVEKPVSMGSLLKPFLALAYLRAGNLPPVMDCRNGCWKPHGHGRQTMVEALAHSCNVYFLRLAKDLDRAALDGVCLSYGLARPKREWTAGRLIGLGDGWPQQPEQMVAAFAQLGEERGQAGANTVLAGMALCAESGTAQGAKLACYAKTGTAPCTHREHGAGDGFAVALYPMERPRHVLLVRQHNTTGAVTAGLLRTLMRDLV